jgi:hypothetical protein
MDKQRNNGERAVPKYSERNLFRNYFVNNNVLYAGLGSNQGGCDEMPETNFLKNHVVKVNVRKAKYRIQNDTETTGLKIIKESVVAGNVYVAVK